jgi:hypothetical protein
VKPQRLHHRFVDEIPSELDEQTVYVSIPYATAVHLCLCGCGTEVVTPLSPTDWELSFNGTSISLDPSIGNWSLRCQSHYWIRHDQVRWAKTWSRAEIETSRKLDCRAKAKYYESLAEPGEYRDDVPKPRILRKLLNLLRITSTTKDS